MKRTAPFTILYLLFLFTGKWSMAQDEKRVLTFMAWNILHGGNDLEDGPQRVIDIIKEINPDVVTMVETYGSGNLVAETLGYHFHLIAPEGTPLYDKSVNLSIFSKYPFGQRIDTEHPFYLGGREVLVDGKKINVFSNWFYYLPWNNEPEKMGKSAEELLSWEAEGKRTEMIEKVLPYLERFADVADSIPMVVGGDMNTLSHLDWGDETKSRHNDLIVPWYATKVLEDIGLKDSYRELNPNPNWHPGITWDSKNAVDSHRIDYIFYKGGLRPIESQSYMAFFGEKIHINGKKITYPSDHGFVVTKFELE